MNAEHLAGDIVWTDLGMPPATVGREIQKLRPAVVVKFEPRLGLAVVVPLTSTPTRHPSAVRIDTNASNGLKNESWAVCLQIRSVSILRLKGSLGHLDDDQHDQFFAVLAEYLAP